MNWLVALPSRSRCLGFFRNDFTFGGQDADLRQRLTFSIFLSHSKLLSPIVAEFFEIIVNGAKYLARFRVFCEVLFDPGLCKVKLIFGYGTKSNRFGNLFAGDSLGLQGKPHFKYSFETTV